MKFLDDGPGKYPEGEYDDGGGVEKEAESSRRGHPPTIKDSGPEAWCTHFDLRIAQALEGCAGEEQPKHVFTHSTCHTTKKAKSGASSFNCDRMGFHVSRSPGKLPRLGVHLDCLSRFDEKRNFDLQAGLEARGLGDAAAGGVAAHARFGVV